MRGAGRTDWPDATGETVHDTPQGGRSDTCEPLPVQTVEDNFASAPPDGPSMRTGMRTQDPSIRSAFNCGSRVNSGAAGSTLVDGA